MWDAGVNSSKFNYIYDSHWIRRPTVALRSQLVLSCSMMDSLEEGKWIIMEKMTLHGTLLGSYNQ